MFRGFFFVLMQRLMISMSINTCFSYSGNLYYPPSVNSLLMDIKGISCNTLLSVLDLLLIPFICRL